MVGGGMDRDENARELAEGMEAEEAGGTAPEDAGQGHAASDRPSFEDAKNSNLTPKEQEELEAAASAALEKLQPTFERAFKPFLDTENSLRLTPSPDFDPERHPGVCERFREWFDTSPLTLGERGTHTFRKLGEIMGVDQRTAAEYYDHPEKIKEWPALALRVNTCPDGRDERIYYEIVHGEGSYNPHVEEEEKRAHIAEAVEILNGMTPTSVELYLGILKHLK